MIDIVINFDQVNKEFKIYEPNSDTLIISKNLTEAFVNLSSFLVSNGISDKDILNNTDINYHLDSFTLINIIESNVNLIKRLQSAPSGFLISSQKFGGTSSIKKKDKDQTSFNNNGFKKSYGDEQRSKKFSNSHKSSSFSGRSGFRTANKKFGGN